MSVADQDPDEEFRRITEGVELISPEGAVDYTTISDMQLSADYHKVRDELIKTDEMHNFNPRGRAAELHSQFSAINNEMRRRFRKE